MTYSDELRYLQTEARAAELADPCPGCGCTYPACECPPEVELCNGLVGEGYRALTEAELDALLGPGGGIPADGDDLSW